MANVLNYFSIALLLLAILYMGRQLNIYLRLRRRMGKKLCPLTPSRRPMKRLAMMGIVAVVFLIVVTIQYVSQGLELNASYPFVLAVVLFSTGRLVNRISEIRQEGILGNLSEIKFSNIKRRKVETSGSRSILTFTLKDGRDFVAVVDHKDLDEVLGYLK